MYFQVEKAAPPPPPLPKRKCKKGGVAWDSSRLHRLGALSISEPNEAGHNAMAFFAIAKTMDLRAQVLGVTPGVCEITEQF